jgi:S-adenosylmethionine synthetase
MASNAYLFTSESVTEGHPDKLADQISDAVLDAVLREDPNGRVACETLVTTGVVVLAGEITCGGWVDFGGVARDTLERIGYTKAEYGIGAKTCAVFNAIDPQSPDIAMGVDTGGAGDQGLMFGYACRETEQLMPLPITLAHALTRRLSDLRHSGQVPWLRPDGKAQVTIRYEDGVARDVHTVVVSTQHDPEVSNEEIRHTIRKDVIDAVIPASMRDDGSLIVHINPTGRFVTGGPQGDCGLTGRKIIVDTYGGVGHHGGGAFSGKDATKVDRSASYMARYVAKNIVAAGLADRVEVQLAYAIGVADPVSVHVDSRGTSTIGDRRLETLIREIFPLTPKGIIETLDLRKPVFSATAAYGHFGRPEFSWERTDRAAELVAAAG